MTPKGLGGGGGDARPTAVVDSGTSIGANCDIAIYELSPASADDGGGSPCLFPVIVRPPDPANILVRVDGNPTGTIPENFTDGWSWLNGGTSAIVLNGSWCTQAQEGAIPQLLVFYGCSIGP